jgi:hypothetical protein
VNRYAVKQSRGLDGPFIFTSASCAIHARIQAAGNNRRDALDGTQNVRAHLYAQTEPGYRCSTVVQGVYAAMKLRLSAWAPLRNPADIIHGLLLPILVHCVDNQGCPLLGPSGNGSEADPAGRTAYKDIPGAVEAIRQYWMPTRFKT